MELNTIYLKKHDIETKHDAIVKRAARLFLREIVEICDLDERKSNSLNTSYYHFSFLLPTHWKYGIREKILRPLFIKAKLITDTDDHSRLLFFTTLESIFPYLQSSENNRNYKTFKKILTNGQHYVMYGFDITDSHLSVCLDLFSAHYPSITSINNYYVPKTLKSIYFDLSLDYTLENDIMFCLENLGFDIQADTTIELKTALINQYKDEVSH